MDLRRGLDWWIRWQCPRGSQSWELWCPGWKPGRRIKYWRVFSFRDETKFRRNFAVPESCEFHFGEISRNVIAQQNGTRRYLRKYAIYSNSREGSSRFFALSWVCPKISVPAACPERNMYRDMQNIHGHAACKFPCCMSQYMLCVSVHICCMSRSNCPCCMSMSAVLGHESVALVWTCNIDVWAYSMDIDTQHVYRWESILTIRRLPQTQSNVIKYYILQFACKIWNF
jgi:hypothetical protein